MPTAASDSSILDRLGIDAGHTAIVGLQWGDEGKGKVVDLLTPGFDCVVRYNGGANAGHSVVVGEQRYALHLVPSGILYPDKLNVLGNGVVIDFEQLAKEIGELRSRGVAIDAANLRISDRAHIVMPYHKRQDALQELAIAQAEGNARAIGTTGRGIGPTYADKAQRSTAIRVCDVLCENSLRQKLASIVALKNTILAALANACGEAFEPFDAGQLADGLLAQIAPLRDCICDTATLLHTAMADGKHLLFEGANATLLDIDHGTYPFVTSSNCSSLGVTTGAGVPGQRLDHVIGIVKAYQTRVGGGPMPTELDDAVGNQIREQGHEYGTTTGRPRRCGWLDLVALKYTSMICGAQGIALMLLDVLVGLPELKVCTAYKLDGEVIHTFPASSAALERVEPVFESLDPLTESMENCNSFDDLPAAAKRYIQFIEKTIGVPVVLASVGPRRDQTLFKHV